MYDQVRQMQCFTARPFSERNHRSRVAVAGFATRRSSPGSPYMSSTWTVAVNSLPLPSTTITNLNSRVLSTTIRQDATHTWRMAVA